MKRKIALLGFIKPQLATLKRLWRLQSGWLRQCPSIGFCKISDGAEGDRAADSAYEQTSSAIDLGDRGDPLSEMIVKKIIEIGQRGVREPDQISAPAIKELAR